MFQKIKTAALPLFCLIALAGCGDHRLKPVVINTAPTVPDGAYSCPAWPSAPSTPLNCTFGGKPALCQSEVAVWIETQVKPAYEQCFDANHKRGL